MGSERELQAEKKKAISLATTCSRQGKDCSLKNPTTALGSRRKKMKKKVPQKSCPSPGLEPRPQGETASRENRRSFTLKVRRGGKRACRGRDLSMEQLERLTKCTLHIDSELRKREFPGRGGSQRRKRGDSSSVDR